LASSGPVGTLAISNLLEVAPLDRLCALPLILLSPTKLSVHQTLQERSVVRGKAAPKSLIITSHLSP
jgi:hypothetical protein